MMKKNDERTENISQNEPHNLKTKDSSEILSSENPGRNNNNKDFKIGVSRKKDDKKGLKVSPLLFAEGLIDGNRTDIKLIIPNFGQSSRKRKHRIDSKRASSKNRSTEETNSYLDETSITERNIKEKFEFKVLTQPTPLGGSNVTREDEYTFNQDALSAIEEFDAVRQNQCKSIKNKTPNESGELVFEENKICKVNDAVYIEAKRTYYQGNEISLDIKNDFEEIYQTNSHEERDPDAKEDLDEVYLKNLCNEQSDVVPEEIFEIDFNQTPEPRIKAEEESSSRLDQVSLKSNHTQVKELDSFTIKDMRMIKDLEPISIGQKSHETNKNIRTCSERHEVHLRTDNEKSSTLSLNHEMKSEEVDENQSQQSLETNESQKYDNKEEETLRNIEEGQQLINDEKHTPMDIKSLKSENRSKGDTSKNDSMLSQEKLKMENNLEAELSDIIEEDSQNGEVQDNNSLNGINYEDNLVKNEVETLSLRSKRSRPDTSADRTLDSGSNKETYYEEKTKFSELKGILQGSKVEDDTQLNINESFDKSYPILDLKTEIDRKSDEINQEAKKNSFDRSRRHSRSSIVFKSPEPQIDSDEEINNILEENNMTNLSDRPLTSTPIEVEEEKPRRISLTSIRATNANEKMSQVNDETVIRKSLSSTGSCKNTAEEEERLEKIKKLESLRKKEDLKLEHGYIYDQWKETICKDGSTGPLRCHFLSTIGLGSNRSRFFCKSILILFMVSYASVQCGILYNPMLLVNIGGKATYQTVNDFSSLITYFRRLIGNEI